MVVRVIANMEFDLEELIKEVAREYEEEINEVTMDDVSSYLRENTTYLSNSNNKMKWAVSDGWPIEGFEENTYYEIEKVLNSFKEDSEDEE